MSEMHDHIKKKLASNPGAFKRTKRKRKHLGSKGSGKGSGASNTIAGSAGSSHTRANNVAKKRVKPLSSSTSTPSIGPLPKAKAESKAK
jgi:hypothetical protein